VLARNQTFKHPADRSRPKDKGRHIDLSIQVPELSGAGCRLNGGTNTPPTQSGLTDCRCAPSGSRVPRHLLNLGMRVPPPTKTPHRRFFFRPSVRIRWGALHGALSKQIEQIRAKGLKATRLQAHSMLKRVPQGPGWPSEKRNDTRGALNTGESLFGFSQPLR